MKFFDDFQCMFAQQRRMGFIFYGAITKGDGTAGGKYVIASGPPDVEKHIQSMELF